MVPRRFEPATGGLGVEYISLQMVANKKTPPANVQTNGVTFFGESWQSTLKVCGLESRSPYLIR